MILPYSYMYSLIKNNNDKILCYPDVRKNLLIPIYVLYSMKIQVLILGLFIHHLIRSDKTLICASN